MISENKTRTTITITKEFLAEVKEFSAMQDVPFNTIVILALKEYLKNHK